MDQNNNAIKKINKQILNTFIIIRSHLFLYYQNKF